LVSEHFSRGNIVNSEREPPLRVNGVPSPVRSRRFVILRKLAFATTPPQALLNLTHSGRGTLMRDIRSDLEERANIIQEQLKASYAHFEKVVQQLQRERDTRVADLNQTLVMIEKLMQFESGVMDNVVTLENPPSTQPSLVDRIRAVNAG
jgi:hypothetical protein